MAIDTDGNGYLDRKEVHAYMLRRASTGLGGACGSGGEGSSSTMISNQVKQFFKAHDGTTMDNVQIGNADNKVTFRGSAAFRSHCSVRITTSDTVCAEYLKGEKWYQEFLEKEVTKHFPNLS